APFRFKPPNGTGGQGQKLVRSLSDMESVIETIDIGELMNEGLVLEENLDRDVTTHSIGQVRLADSVISYFGVQHVVSNNEGRPAYGGSDLAVVKTEFANLFTMQSLTPAVR